jgi:cellulose biosynthesis protein BcsQ
MARKIAVINHKGGPGKTFVTVNLAAIAAAETNSEGKRINRVLLVDMDPQGNASQYLELDQLIRTRTKLPEIPAFQDAEHKDLGLVLRDDKSFRDAALPYFYKKFIPDSEVKKGVSYTFKFWDHKKRANVTRAYVPEFVENFHVVPAYQDIDIDMDIDEFLYKYPLEKLKEKIDEVEGDYDYIFFDCGPSWNKLSKGAVLAAGNIIIPIKPGFFEFAGIAAIIKSKNSLQEKTGIEIDLCKVVMNHFQAHIKEHMEDLVKTKQSVGDYLAATWFPLSVEVIRSVQNKFPLAFSESKKSKMKVLVEAFFSEIKNYFAAKETKKEAAHV